MSNDFYNASGYPATNSAGTSASARAEFASVAAGFDKLPPLSGQAYKLPFVNASGTGLTVGLLYTDASGNVGIGTSVPRAKLHVNAGGLMVNGVQTSHAQGAYLEWNRSNGNGETNFVNQKGLGGGGFTWSEVDSANNATQHMTLDSGGKLGIGVASPVQVLDVNGHAWLRGGTLVLGPAGVAPLAVNAANQTFVRGDAIFFQNTGGTFNLAIMNGAGWLSLASSAAPLAPLDIANTRITGSVLLNGPNVSAATGMKMGYNGGGLVLIRGADIGGNSFTRLYLVALRVGGGQVGDVVAVTLIAQNGSSAPAHTFTSNGTDLVVSHTSSTSNNLSWITCIGN